MMSEEKKGQAPILSVQGLTVEYTSDGQTVHAVNNISLRLEHGHTLGLVGETGAGKTTLAKTILRILPDVGSRVISGTILVDGEDILQLPEKRMQAIRGNKISMIFQDPMTALNPVMPIGEQIAETVKLHHPEMSREQYEKRAREMLETVGISADRFCEYPHQFSGGMKQRVVIAMALACNPELLLADEPTTALDVTIQAQVMDLIGGLRERFNTAMLLITHDMGVVAQVCDEVAVIYAGSIVEYGTKEQIFDHPSHPYTRGLFAAIPSMNRDEEWLRPIDGLPPDPTSLPPGCPFWPRCRYANEECKSSGPAAHLTADGHECYCRRLDIVGKEDA